MTDREAYEARIEAVARVIREEDEGRTDVAWSRLPKEARELWLLMARAADAAVLKAIEEPTDKMVFECYGADRDPESIGETGRSYWRAMHRAIPRGTS